MGGEIHPSGLLHAREAVVGPSLGINLQKSVVTYSREAFTSIYAKLRLMYVKIRRGEFVPDLRAVERVLQLTSAVDVDEPTGTVDVDASELPAAEQVSVDDPEDSD